MFIVPLGYDPIKYVARSRMCAQFDYTRASHGLDKFDWVVL